MVKFKDNQRPRIGGIRRKTSCCGPQSKEDIGASSCCPGTSKQEEIVNAAFAPNIAAKVSTDWTREDIIGQIKCRISSFRNSYTVVPGLYAVGKPDKDSDVLVSANYKLSFDILRRSLKGMDAWIIVLDTKGINVWCAAGKGTFGTEELIRQIQELQLDHLVRHRKIIVPQLGAPGISAHTVSKKTGFRVFYGPVDAGDIPAYIAAGYNATRDMRTARFTWRDRLILTPMEIIPIMKKFPVYALIILIIFGVQPSGILFRDSLTGGWPFLFMGLVSVLTGAFITPLFLPFIPSRAFAIKGWIAGVILVFLFLNLTGMMENANRNLLIFSYLFYPLLSSYIALQFTGSTAFTGMSGVKKELKFAIPIYIVAAVISVILLTLFKFGQWGLI